MSTADPLWRAVIDVPQDTGKASLAALHAVGVRGVRFDLGTPASDNLDPLLTIRRPDRAVRLACRNQARRARCGTGAREGRVAADAVSAGRLLLGPRRSSRRTGGRTTFDFLLGMVQLGRYWLKLSSNDLAPPQLKLWDEPPPLTRALQAVRKDRLIWGSGKQPDGDGTAHLTSSLAMLEKCVPHPGDREQVLVDNPATLYGFDRATAEACRPAKPERRFGHCTNSLPCYVWSRP